MHRYIPIVAILCSFAFTQFGCESPVSGPPKIVVTRDGRVTLDGQPVKAEQLGKKLKSMGVPTTAAILVSVYKDIPKTMEGNIARPLVTAGYRKLMFVEPREITVSTSTTTQTVSYASPTGTKQPKTSTKSSSSASPGL